MQTITREVLLDLRPSGVLQKMIDGLERHEALPDCIVDMATFGSIIGVISDDNPDSKYVYSLCASTCTVCEIMNTTFSEICQKAEKSEKLAPTIS